MSARHDHAACCDSKAARKPLYRDPVVGLAALIAAICVTAEYWPALVPFRRVLTGYLRLIVLPVSVGLLIGGFVEAVVPRELISRLLAGARRRTILRAVSLGFLMSVCSHGILAIAIELHKKGASNAAVVAFLLASPWANVPLTLLLLAFFGLKAFYFIFGAIGIAITTGLVFQILERRGWIEANPHTVARSAGSSVWSDIERRWKEISSSPIGLAQKVFGGAFALGDMVLGWILVGVLAAGAAGTFVPHGFFDRYMGPDAIGLLVTLASATVIEVCSEGTSPLALEIYRHTGAFGNAFVFLMAGVVTDLSEIGLVWTHMGRRTAIMIPAVALPQVIVLGLFANRFF